MDGFGEKSYQNLIDSIERAKNTTLPRLIFGLGILNIGLANARMICKAFDFDFDRIRNASAEDFAQIDGVGEVIAKSIVDYFADEENKERLERLLSYLTIEKPRASQEEQKLAGLTFVITGSVEHFPNRNALKARIEELGGKATGSVTGKTSYLINNDTTSSSSKNRKARELGVPVISEEDRRITKYLQRRFASRAGICYNRKQTAEIPAGKSKPPVCAEKSAADQEE